MARKVGGKTIVESMNTMSDKPHSKKGRHVDVRDCVLVASLVDEQGRGAASVLIILRKRRCAPV